MYNNEKIGVGILTYNRKDSFYNLFTKVKNNVDVDYIVVVKNKNVDYDNADPKNFQNNKNIFYYNIIDDIGIGFCKNVCMKKLLDLGCDHIFVIEDDIIIKNDLVFRKHVLTAKSYNLGHLNYNTLSNVDNNPTYTINNGSELLDISFRVCGCFSYFERNALQQCGLINSKDYINALEHVEHAYRFSIMGYDPPFYAFPGIHKCHEYLQEYSESTTINRGEKLYNDRLHAAFINFTRTYGKNLNQIAIPTQANVIDYFKNRRT